jgi:uncharacterized delta-60 repeat protein
VGGQLYSNTTSSLIPRVVRLNRDGSFDAGFQPLTGYPLGPVLSFATQPDGRILVGGGFPNVQFSARSYLLRLLANGVLDTGFAFDQASPNGAVHSIGLGPEGSIYIGGWNRSGLARLRSNGHLDLGFEPPRLNSRVVNTVLPLGDGKVLAGGSFRTVEGLPFNRVVRLNRDGQVDLTFNPGWGLTDGSSAFDEYEDFVDSTQAFALAADPEGKVMVASDVGRVDGVPRNNVARLSGRDPSMRISSRPVMAPAGARIELRWEAGALQRVVSMQGPWQEVAGAASPLLVPPSEAQTFYRLRFD